MRNEEDRRATWFGFGSFDAIVPFPDGRNLVGELKPSGRLALLDVGPAESWTQS